MGKSSKDIVPTCGTQGILHKVASRDDVIGLIKRVPLAGGWKMDKKTTRGYVRRLATKALEWSMQK